MMSVLRNRARHVMCGWIVAFQCCTAEVVEDRADRQMLLSAQDGGALQAQSYVWDLERPILPSPYSLPVRQMSFSTFDESAAVLIPVLQGEDTERPDDQTVIIEVVEEIPDLESCVRAMEQLLAEPTEDDHNEPRADKSVTSHLYHLGKSFAESEGEGSKFVEAEWINIRLQRPAVICN
ncbi:MAG: hypothetical protein P8K08_07155 [Fuerstiella sp.]|nr:hypothetical protein [Fuerstiella sp.]